MPDAAAETLAIAVLAVVLAAAVAGRRRVPELAVAAPGAALLVGLGIVTPQQAWDRIAELGPTVGFLAAILVLAHLCDEEGVFTAAGHLMARRSRGSPRPLLAMVFLVASVTTALLSLDATVVLLTPVVLITARSLRASPRPHAYACAHLANSASLLLPVSNLTNLLAFSATGLSFTRFGLLMLGPWIVAIAVEYGLFRWRFARDLTGADTGAPAEDIRLPGFALIVLGATLLGFGLSSTAGIEPVWVATAGAAVLAARRLVRRRTTPQRLLAETSPAFCLFVLALGVIVEGVATHGLGTGLDRLVPSGDGFLDLLAVAALAAVLANVLNNLPAVLLLLTVAGSPALLLAVLVGVNIGPNLTYAGSLAGMLWRRVLEARGIRESAREFSGLGMLTVPPAIVAAVGALWLALRAVGI